MGKSSLGVSVLCFAFWLGAIFDPEPDTLRLVVAAGCIFTAVSFVQEWRESRMAARDSDSLELARQLREKERVLAQRERVIAARERAMDDAEAKLLRAASTTPSGRN